MVLNLDSQPKKLEFCPLDCENSPRPGLSNDHHDALVTVITAKIVYLGTESAAQEPSRRTYSDQKNNFDRGIVSKVTAK